MAEHSTDTHEHSSLSEQEQMGEQMMRQQHQQALWVDFAVMIVGLWLISSPFTFGYDDTAMTISDVVCGVALVVLGILSLPLERGWIRWATCAIGIWLLVAPVALWASTPAALATDSFAGALAVAFSILVPGMPGMRMLPGPTVPPGWSYNPSDWLQRAPVIALGIVSFFLSRYLSAYQLGFIDDVWDPIFDEGTVRVLDSKVSRAWPVSDAGFGAFSYMLEALSGFMGGRDRWRTMPWMVLMFGFLVIPLGIVSITLIVLQPVMVGQWCSICLLTAFFMLVMIPLAIDEVVAMGQFMASVRREGKPFWTNFWKGGTMPGEGEGEEQGRTTWHDPTSEIAKASVYGVTVPWNLLVSALLGFWLMASPAIFNATGAAADSDHLVGPLIATIAVIAMAEVIRSLRFLNVATGLWLIASPWFFSGDTTGSTVNDLLVGVALLALSLPRGAIYQHYAGWTAWTR